MSRWTRTFTFTDEQITRLADAMRVLPEDVDNDTLAAFFEELLDDRERGYSDGELDDEIEDALAAQNSALTGSGTPVERPSRHPSLEEQWRAYSFG